MLLFKSLQGLYVQLAMVKNQRLAEKLFNGNIYDSICKFEPVS
jgi:type II pantothenate kinase